ncbi:MAG: hypothetical protein ACI4JM_09360 [Oscillospiraceae bacterium]
MEKIGEIKSFLPSFFSKKLAVSKDRAFGRCWGCGGGSPRPSIVPKKFFGNLFIKKGWAAFSRLMKFSVNYNGRPMVATTKIIHRTHVIL